MTSNANENVKHSSLLMQGRVRRKSQKNLSMKKENDDEGEIRTDQSGGVAAD